MLLVRFTTLSTALPSRGVTLNTALPSNGVTLSTALLSRAVTLSTALPSRGVTLSTPLPSRGVTLSTALPSRAVRISTALPSNAIEQLDFLTLSFVLLMSDFNSDLAELLPSEKKRESNLVYITIVSRMKNTHRKKEKKITSHRNILVSG